MLVVASHSTSEGDGSEWSRGNDLATGGGGKFVCVCGGGGRLINSKGILYKHMT